MAGDAMSRGPGKRQRAILEYLASTDKPTDIHTIIAAVEGLELRSAPHAVYESFRRAIKRLREDDKVLQVGYTNQTTYAGQLTTPTFQLLHVALPRTIEKREKSVPSLNNTLHR